VSNGFFQLAGVQNATAAGGAGYLGPYAIAFGPVIDIQAVVVNTTATVPVPTGALGVCVTAPIGNSTPTLQWSTVSLANAQAGNYIAPGVPSLWEFDPAHRPSNIYLSSGGNVTVQVQFT
jgi:hypothetical protein